MLAKLFNLKNLIWFCAIGLATFSGYYSVFGISKLFSGGSWSVVGMAAMLELSKLVVVRFLHDNFKSLTTLFKIYLTSAMIVLMSITSIGVYGYLTNSYQETAKVIYKSQNELTLLDQKKKVFEEQKIQIEKNVQEKTERLKSIDQIRISQQNAYTQQLSQKGRTGGLSKNISSTDKTSEILNGEIAMMTQKSFALADSIVSIEQSKHTITNESFTSELGPLLYLSRITGLPMDIVVNWFIIILVIVFDPLAISLVVAANHLKHNDETTPPVDIEEDIITEQMEEPHEEELVEEENLENQELQDLEQIEELNNEEQKDLLNEEKNSILGEGVDSKTINTFYDEVEEEIVDNGVDDPWKPVIKYKR